MVAVAGDSGSADAASPVLGYAARPPRHDGSSRVDAFSYLSVLISLILGLAITQVLGGIRGLMQSRSRLVGYWPAVTWAILVVVISVQSWWSMYGLRHYEPWAFVGFAAVLSQTVVLYLLAALILPDFVGDAAVDLRQHYYGQRRWFFALLVVLILASIGKQLALQGTLPPPVDLAFHAAFAALGLSGVLIGRPRYHELLAIAGTLLIGAYIALLFARLD